jgi:Concanavalin A-like lectin/glucanases superfamily
MRIRYTIAALGAALAVGGAVAPAAFANGPTVAPGAVAASPCGGPRTGLVSCWPGDGTPDDAVGANNGSWVGTPAYGPGPAGGQAFQFDGSSSYINLGDPPSLKLTGAITLDAWVNPASLSTGISSVISKWAQNEATDSYGLGVSGAPGWGCASPDSAVGAVGVSGVSECGVGGGSLAAGVWTNVGMTYDGSSGVLSVYVNGIQVRSHRVPGGINPSDVNVQIGHQGQGDCRYFAGLIADVSIYNRALTTSEMSEFGRATAPSVSGTGKGTGQDGRATAPSVSGTGKGTGQGGRATAPSVSGTGTKPSASGLVTGLATGHPVLTFRVTDAPGPQIASVAVGLPDGLKFSRSAIARRMVKGLRISGDSAKSVALKGGRLSITLKKPVASVTITAAGPLVIETNSLQTKVRKHKVRSLSFTLKVTTANRQTTSLTLKPNAQ